MSDLTKEFTSISFDKDVLKSEALVLVDFWAEWCGPCKVLSQTVDHLAKEYTGKVVVGKVNVDDCNDIASNYGVMSIPTLILFKNGHPVDQLMGLVPKNAIEKLITQHL